MAISKEQALYNVSKEWLDYQVASRLYWDSVGVRDADRDYQIASTAIDVMRDAYIDSGLLTFDEIRQVTGERYKVEKIKQPE